MIMNTTPTRIKNRRRGYYLFCTIALLILSGFLPAVVRDDIDYSGEGYGRNGEENDTLSFLEEGPGAMGSTRGERRTTGEDILVEEGQNKTFSDETIHAGRVLVEENGSLTFQNVTLLFSSDARAEQSLVVETNGSFFCYDSNISTEGARDSFSFTVNGRLYMKNSSVSRIFGQSNDGYWGGLTIFSGSNRSVIRDSRFSDSYIGISIMSTATITGNHFTNNTRAIYSLPILARAWGIATSVGIRGNQFQDNEYDIHIIQGTRDTTIQENVFSGTLSLDCPGLVLKDNEFWEGASSYLQGTGMTIQGNRFSPETFTENAWIINDSTVSSNDFSCEEAIHLAVGGGGLVFRDNSFTTQEAHLGFLSEELSDLDNDVDTSNTINGRPIYYLFNETGTELTGRDHDPSVVFAMGCRDLRLSGLSLENVSGLYLFETHDSLIEDISSRRGPSTTGIYLESSENNTIRNASIAHLDLRYSHNNSLENVVCESTESRSREGGVYLYGSHDGLISDCVVSGVDEGIKLVDAERTTIQDCSITGNGVGILVTRNCIDTIVVNSRIYDNKEWGMDAAGNSRRFVVHATDNWWGHGSGPFHLTRNPTGLGDNVTDGVRFEPWLKRDEQGEGNEDKDEEEVLQGVILPASLVAAGFLVSFSVIYFFSEYYRFRILCGLAPLFSRIGKDQLMDNNNREQIYHYIKDHPGDHIAEISRNVGFDEKTVVYHINVLRRERAIRVVRNRKFVQCFLKGVKVDNRTPAQLRILSVIENNPGLNFGELRTRTKLGERTLRDHLKFLDSELVVKRDGKYKRYFVNT